jgi:hypothetical protein
LSATQESLDAFYFAHGPCCAGCDWWGAYNSVAGECTKSAPVPSVERFAMLGMENLSIDGGAGHIITPREHVCGDFKDDFDWRSLPLGYLCRIGGRDALERLSVEGRKEG